MQVFPVMQRALNHGQFDPPTSPASAQSPVHGAMGEEDDGLPFRDRVIDQLEEISPGFGNSVRELGSKIARQTFTNEDPKIEWPFVFERGGHHYHYWSSAPVGKGNRGRHRQCHEGFSHANLVCQNDSRPTGEPQENITGGDFLALGILTEMPRFRTRRSISSAKGYHGLMRKPPGTPSRHIV